jgi:hypothetical protein
LKRIAEIRPTALSPCPRKARAPPRFDALKSSIDANTYVIPGEDAGELQAVIEGYRDRFLPDNALERFLVDGMISANWELRRLRMVEMQLAAGTGGRR